MSILGVALVILGGIASLLAWSAAVVLCGYEAYTDYVAGDLGYAWLWGALCLFSLRVTFGSISATKA